MTDDVSKANVTSKMTSTATVEHVDEDAETSGVA